MWQVVDLGKQSSRRQLAAIALAPLADTGAAAPAVSAPSVAILNPAVPVPLNQVRPVSFSSRETSLTWEPDHLPEPIEE